MASQYKIFDRQRLRLQPLARREHDLHVGHWLNAQDAPLPFNNRDLKRVARAIVRARRAKAAVILMMGAHVLRAGVNRHLIELMEKKFITHLAMNGSGPIHDYELARIGATTESVARYIQTGEFGLWRETGELNDIIKRGARGKLGLGESVGQHIARSNYPHKELSLTAAAYRLRVPVTVHVGVGYDIIHEHPNCDGAALGATSYRDFLIFAKSVENLEDGVLLCFGTAVMGPEVFLKALAMARNTGRQKQRSIRNFTTAVFDLIPLKGDWRKQATKSDYQYYYRPWKTLLVRTVAGGGESFYFCGDHRATVPALHHLMAASK
jgi:hypothetical protein